MPELNASIAALPAENGQSFFHRTVRLFNATGTVAIEIDKDGAWYVDAQDLDGWCGVGAVRSPLTMDLLREMLVIWFSQEVRQC